MADELKDILSPSNKDSGQEELLKYLNKQLSAGQQHELEKQLLNDDFENDAVEGLEQIDNKASLELTVNALNRELRKKTANKKKQKEKLQLKPQWWLYFSILILLIILVMIYLYLHRQINL